MSVWKSVDVFAGVLCFSLWKQDDCGQVHRGVTLRPSQTPFRPRDAPRATTHPNEGPSGVDSLAKVGRQAKYQTGTRSVGAFGACDALLRKTRQRMKMRLNPQATPRAPAHHARLLQHSVPHTHASTCLGLKPICNHGGAHELQYEDIYAYTASKLDVVRCDLGVHVCWRTRCGRGVTPNPHRVHQRTTHPLLQHSAYEWS